MQNPWPILFILVAHGQFALLTLFTIADSLHCVSCDSLNSFSMLNDILKCGNGRCVMSVKKKTERVFQLSPFQYPDPGSNRDGLPHWCLRPARLPIPPSGQSLDCGAKVVLFLFRAKKKCIFLKKSFICLSVPLKRSNFAGRLLSTHAMGVRYFRSLSVSMYTI